MPNRRAIHKMSHNSALKIKSVDVLEQHHG